MAIVRPSLRPVEVALAHPPAFLSRYFCECAAPSFRQLFLQAIGQNVRPLIRTRVIAVDSKRRRSQVGIGVDVHGEAFPGLFSFLLPF